jgi:hypothetical protein
LSDFVWDFFERNIHDFALMFRFQDMQNRDHIDMKGQVALQKGKQLASKFDGWGKKYLVEFDIVVNRLERERVLNVFRMTSTDNNYGNHGDRIPAVFVERENRFTFVAPATAITWSFQLNTLYHIEIKQDFHESSKFGIYCIKINGEIQLSCQKIKSPRTFDDVKIYTSDHWHESFANYGKLSNLLIRKL